MTDTQALAPRRSVLLRTAARFGVEPTALERILSSTVMPAKATREHVAAFLLVAEKYGLNPLTREIYAFPGSGGGVTPIVSVDGWARLCNEHPQYDGCAFRWEWAQDGKQLVSCTAIIYRKDRSHAVEVTEYMAECARQGNPVWARWPARMLRHKAFIQAARLAFGFAGIADDLDNDPTNASVVVSAEVEPMATSPADALSAVAQQLTEGAPEAFERPEDIPFDAPKKTRAAKALFDAGDQGTTHPGD